MGGIHILNPNNGMWIQPAYGKIGFGNDHRTNLVATITEQGKYEELSDVRVKYDICEIPNALHRILTVSGRTYRMNNTPSEDIYYGCIAQEVQKEFPELVSSCPSEYTDDKTILSLNYSGLIPVLIEAIRELHMQVETMKLERDTVKK